MPAKRVLDLQGRPARPLVVGEQPHVVSPARLVPEGVVGLDPALGVQHDVHGVHHTDACTQAGRRAGEAGRWAVD